MSDANRLGTAVLPAGGEHTVEAHWRIFLAEGIGLIVLGLAALILPPLASIGVAILLGWLLLLGGVFGLVTTIVGRHAPGFLWSLLSSIFAIVAGCSPFRLARGRCIVVDFDPYGVSGRGRHSHYHDRVGLPPGIAWPLGLVVGQWRARFDFGRHHIRHAARFGTLGDWHHRGN